jgi:hypothetical protein
LAVSCFWAHQGGPGACCSTCAAEHDLHGGFDKLAFVPFYSVVLLGTVLVGLLPASFSSPAAAENRVALVIGNSAYEHAPRLPNPVNDANDVGAALKRDGFETIVATDLNKSAMEEAAIRFAKAARDADVAIFYYSGHALQFAGVNYLAPVDADLRDETDLRRMVRLEDVVVDLQRARNLRILVQGRLPKWVKLGSDPACTAGPLYPR